MRYEDEYFEILKSIARSIIKKLDIIPQAAIETCLSASGRTVFLAESARDLRDARHRLVNDFTRAGHAVVPDIDILPDTVAGYEAAIRAPWTKPRWPCSCSVATAVLRRRAARSRIPDLQLRLARKRRTLPRVFWAPKWLPGHPNTKRDPFEVASRFGGLKASEELFGEEVTDLSKWLRDRLDPKAQLATTGAAPGLVLIAAADTADAAAAVHLARLLQGVGPRILPVGPEDLLPTVEESGPPRVLVLWGAAEAAAVDACLNGLPAAPAPICLLLSGGDETAKSRFFREGVVAQKLQSLPDDPKSAWSLLEQMEILPSRSGR